jgi:transcriptional regulator with XRE-family HTH domain
MPYPNARRLTVSSSRRGPMPARTLVTWNDRLNWALKQRGVSKAALARSCGVERASITDWTNGKTKDPKLVPFFLACDTLRLQPRWLAIGEGPIEPITDSADSGRHESLLQTVARLAEQLSSADQRRVLTILQNS